MQITPSRDLVVTRPMIEPTASPADLVGVVTVCVASLADAGVASLTNLAGGTMKLTVPVCARTEEVTLVQKCPGRDCSVMHGSVTGNGDLDGRGCRGMPEMCGDSTWQCVGYVGYNYKPDYVDQAVPKGGDEYPFGTLLSEPLCVITDNRTYQEKIGAPSGTIYDYDDVNDNTPCYFDYDDQRDYEEWGGWDDPGDDGMYYDPYRSDVTNDETVVSRPWLGVQSDGTLTAPELTVTEISDRSPLITPELDGKPWGALVWVRWISRMLQ